MVKSITRGVVSFLPAWKGREDSEYLLNNNTLQHQRLWSFLHKWSLQIEEIVIYLGSSGYHII